MESVHGDGLAPKQSELMDVVRGVRNRYRAKRALRGAAITVAVGFVLLTASAYAMSVLKYTDGAVLGGRLVALVAIAAMTAWLVVRPLLPGLGDEQVALYLEEHEQSLNAALVTAVEMQRAAAPNSAPRSPVL